MPVCNCITCHNSDTQILRYSPNSDIQHPIVNLKIYGQNNHFVFLFVCVCWGGVQFQLVLRNCVVLCYAIQRTEFCASTKTRSYSKELVHLQKGATLAGDTQVWWKERLLIPPVPPSGLVHCNIINVYYYIQVARGII